jgi:hypothetical protein
MGNYKLETGAGDTIQDVATNARKQATILGGKQNVEFDFNGITCIVSDKTVVDWLVRDYMNANIMGWEIVGPECKMQYDVDTEIELYSRKLKRAKKNIAGRARKKR